MSGVEILGAAAAATGLIEFALEIALELKRRCNKTAENFKALEQTKVLGLVQITSLRIMFKTLASSFEKYNSDVIESLSPKDKHNIGEIVKDTYRVIERCEGTISKLRALVKKKIHDKSELDVLRDELDGAVSLMQVLQKAFDTHINLETLRRVSRGNAEHEPCNSGKPLGRRDSELESIAPASRQATSDSNWSMQTMTPALSPESTHTTGPCVGSLSSSPNLSRSITLVESEQLRSSVDDEDRTRIEQLIRQKTTEIEKESWKVSALFRACSFRRTTLVQYLFSLDPNLSVTDEFGLGVMHATIGASEQLSKAKEQATADILKLLVERHPPLIRSTDKEKRQPLHYCAMTGNYLAAHYILGYDKTTINATDSRKKTPLYHICEHHSPNKRLLKLFLQNGGNFGTRHRPMMTDVRLRGIKKMLDAEEKGRKLTLPP